jgi:diadenosine tetraphosphate (Ap4A) HIT family hydrolase
MPSVFTRIIDGELPGRFVWRDDTVVAFLTIEPMRPGHTLVVPREEVDHWVDMDPELAERLFTAARVLGKAIDRAFRPRRVGVMVVGDEVPHVHVHLVPIDHAGQLSFASVDRDAKAEDLDDAAERIRIELRAMGRAEASD